MTRAAGGTPFHWPHVGEIDSAVAVEVRIGTSSEEHRIQRAEVGEIHSAVVIQVCIAGVAVAITVGISLIRISDLDAVVVAVADAVSVCVTGSTETTLSTIPSRASPWSKNWNTLSLRPVRAGESSV